MILKSWELVLMTAGVVLLSACAATDNSSPRMPGRGTPLNTDLVNSSIITLPKPVLTGDKSLEEALSHRKSLRDYRKDELSLEEISQLLWACQGLRNDPEYPPGRTAPSAGGFHPMEIFLFTPQGVFRYVPANHSMAVIKQGDTREDLRLASLGQQSIGTAPVVFVIAGKLLPEAVAKYKEREERYIILEAGCACQNLLLEAVSLDLGAVPIGAFNDEKITELLGLDKLNAFPFLIVPVGKPIN